jgi:aldehyde oxidoreductase
MAPLPLAFRLNGAEVTVSVPPSSRLLDVLREGFGLTAAKEGCGLGECGACTVLLDGQPVNSCMVPAWQVDGSDVTTLEGLGSPEALHPLQAAFVEKGAIQCGFCTPGMIVAGAAALRDHPDATRDQLRRLMSGNVCRCTGYRQILDALEKGRDRRPDVTAQIDRIGEAVTRVDAVDKATGTCRYTADIPWPMDCLHGATVRAEHVHARLLALHVEDALAVPGVLRVLTWRDVPGRLHYGNAVPDQPVFAKDHIRFWGEAVALVLAESLEAAREGASKVRVEAEDLPVVVDPETALEEGSPSLHPAYPGTVKSVEGNLLCHLKLLKGDLDVGMATADVSIERCYSSASQEHLCLEPEAALAIPGPDGVITCIAPSQNVFFDRLHISTTLDLPRERVHVIQAPTGAAFGSREDVYAQIHASLGALLCGRPTRIVWTREETQVATTKRHPVKARLRAGLRRDGRILALEVDVLSDTGAYASWGPNIARKMLVHAAGPYEIPNVRVDVRLAYTNNGISGAFRGFGAAQVLYAVECFADEAAAELGMDPLAFRRINHLAEGRVTATGQTIHGSCGLAECVSRALVAAGPRPEAQDGPDRPDLAVGRGLSTIFYGIGYGNAIPDIGSAIVALVPSGVFEIRCGAVDYGQGSLTVFTQIAGEVLGVSRRKIVLLTGDSATTPDSGSTVASRQTYVSGEAVRQAAERLRADLLDFGASRFGVSRSTVGLCDDGLFSDQVRLASLSELADAALSAGLKTSHQARFRASTSKLDAATGQGDAYWPYAWACHVADVLVDRKTGLVRVTQVVAAHDVGRVINPAMAEGQVAGGVAQGLGFALMEEHLFENGVPLTRGLDTYRVPGFCDVPDVLPIFVEAREPTGPFGAKGLGEPVLVAIAPAIANAVADAIGVRIRDLPITPEKVLSALAPFSVVTSPGRGPG